MERQRLLRIEADACRPPPQLKLSTPEELINRVRWRLRDMGFCPPRHEILINGEVEVIAVRSSAFDSYANTQSKVLNTNKIPKRISMLDFPYYETIAASESLTIGKSEGLVVVINTKQITGGDFIVFPVRQGKVETQLDQPIQSLTAYMAEEIRYMADLSKEGIICSQICSTPSIGYAHTKCQADSIREMPLPIRYALSNQTKVDMQNFTLRLVAQVDGHQVTLGCFTTEDPNKALSVAQLLEENGYGYDVIYYDGDIYILPVNLVYDTLMGEPPLAHSMSLDGIIGTVLLPLDANVNGESIVWKGQKVSIRDHLDSIYRGVQARTLSPGELEYLIRNSFLG